MTSKEIAQHFKSLDKGYVDNWDELLEEKINQFALHIAEQAVGEKRDARANRILSRIKQLTSE